MGRALSLYEEMQACGMQPDSTTLNSLLTACAGSSHWDAALALCREAEGSGGVALDSVTYCALIDGCTRAGRWEAALEVRRLLEASPSYPPGTVRTESSRKCPLVILPPAIRTARQAAPSPSNPRRLG
jgi:pentatricopeptide repeat protein